MASQTNSTDKELEALNKSLLEHKWKITKFKDGVIFPGYNIPHPDVDGKVTVAYLRTRIDHAFEALRLIEGSNIDKDAKTRLWMLLKHDILESRAVMGAHLRV